VNVNDDAIGVYGDRDRDSLGLRLLSSLGHPAPYMYLHIMNKPSSIFCMLHTSLYLFSNFDTRKNDVDGRIGSISTGYSMIHPFDYTYHTRCPVCRYVHTYDRYVSRVVIQIIEYDHL
jgi:hypothetical protein